jgi:hypothetical protein
MSKKPEQEQKEAAHADPKPVLSRRELLIRTGQVALVIGSADVLATLVTACTTDAKGPHGGRVTKCYPFRGYQDKQWAAYYGYSKYCYEVYSYDGETYGHYFAKSRAQVAAPPRYQRGA